MAKFPSNDVDKFVGQRIQQKRKERGYTAEQLSEYVEISQPQFSRYERGASKINLSHLVKIANYLETPISYFFLDCMDEASWNQDELDLYWQSLSYTQKNSFVDFIKVIREEKK